MKFNNDLVKKGKKKTENRILIVLWLALDFLGSSIALLFNIF